MSGLTPRALAQLLGQWRGGDGAAYQALADRIRLLVLDGRIPLRTRLPAERELAAQLELSRTTVSAAYAALRDGGYLDSVRGSGSLARLPGAAPIAAEPIQSELLDLTKAAMPTLPRVAGAAQRAASALPGHLGDSGYDPIGLPALRSAVAERYTARGLPTAADEILVTVGAQHAIALIARTLLSRGDRALVESPSYPHAIDALRAAGARPVPVGVSSDEGWDVAGFENQLRRATPTLGYLMPDVHNPTGLTLPLAARQRMLELAERHSTMLVADETMGELVLGGGEVLPPFAASANPASASRSGSPPVAPITIGSVGKTIWGGLRVGWIRADRDTVERLARARLANDLGTPILDQLVVLDLLADYDSILDERRAYLAAGRDHLRARLAERIPEWRMPPVPGGLTAWVALGEPVSSSLALAARAEGLLLAAGPRFGLDGVFERFLRIPFSYPTAVTDRAVNALAAAWARVNGTIAQPAPREFAAIV